jgi:hypothetical protein
VAAQHQFIGADRQGWYSAAAQPCSSTRSVPCSHRFPVKFPRGVISGRSQAEQSVRRFRLQQNDMHLLCAIRRSGLSNLQQTAMSTRTPLPPGLRAPARQTHESVSRHRCAMTEIAGTEAYACRVSVPLNWDRARQCGVPAAGATL